MNSSLTIKEQTHHRIKQGTYFSGVLCILFFTLFWNLDTPVWGNIFRLASFAFFALTVMGYLNIMNGPMTITLTFSDEYLLISYRKQNSIIGEEQFDYSTIKEVTSIQTQSNPVYSLLQPHSAALKVNFTDVDRELYLIEFGGRPLFFNNAVINKIKGFLESNEITFTAR